MDVCICGELLFVVYVVGIFGVDVDVFEVDRVRAVCLIVFEGCASSLKFFEVLLKCVVHNVFCCGL